MREMGVVCCLLLPGSGQRTAAGLDGTKRLFVHIMASFFCGV
jgi:hypothetical protein